MKMLRLLLLAVVITTLVSACGSDRDGDNQADNSQLVLGTFKQEVAKSLVLGLAKGVGSEVGGDATGWVVGNLFGGADDPSAPDAATEDAIKEVGGKIDTLSSQVENFQNEVDNALKKLYTQGQKVQYSTIVQPLEKTMANIKRINNDLVRLETQIAPNTEDWKTLATEIKDKDLVISDRKTDLIQIQTAMENGELDGAIQLWGDITIDNLKSSNAEDCFWSVMNQFQRYYLAQADLLNFIIEKAHKKYADSNSEASPDLKLYRTEMLKQSKIFLNQAERILAFFNNVYVNENFTFHSDWHIQNGFNLVDSSDYQSPHLAVADEIVGQAMGWKNSLTIRIADIYAGEAHELLSGITVVLVNKAGEEFPAETYAAQISRRVYSSQKASDPLYKGQYYQWDIKRFVFNDLPNGQYRLKDVYSDYAIWFEGKDIKLLDDEYLDNIFIIKDGVYKNMLCLTYQQ